MMTLKAGVASYEDVKAHATAVARGGRRMSAEGRSCGS
jgi:hypothetical protein